MYKVFMLFVRGIQYFNTRIKLSFWKIVYGNRVSFGKNIKIRKRFNLYIGPNAKLAIGDNCFFNNDCSINCMDIIEIGKDNLFGENVKIYDHNHIFNDKTINRAKNFKTGEILIGNNNWFGSNVVILAKTVIEDNNVIKIYARLSIF